MDMHFVNRMNRVHIVVKFNKAGEVSSQVSMKFDSSKFENFEKNMTQKEFSDSGGSRGFPRAAKTAPDSDP